MIKELENLWDDITGYNIATEEELRLVTDIYGYSVEVLNSVIYARTGLRDMEQLKEEFDFE